MNTEGYTEDSRHEEARIYRAFSFFVSLCDSLDFYKIVIRNPMLYPPELRGREVEQLRILPTA